MKKLLFTLFLALVGIASLQSMEPNGSPKRKRDLDNTSDTRRPKRKRVQKILFNDPITLATLKEELQYKIIENLAPNPITATREEALDFYKTIASLKMATKLLRPATTDVLEDWNNNFQFLHGGYSYQDMQAHITHLKSLSNGNLHIKTA